MATSFDSQTGSLHAELEATKDHLATLLAADQLATLDAEQRRLREGDAAALQGRVQVGDRLPTATLVDAYGASVQVPGHSATVVVFYRGAWCPFCNLALATYQREVLPELTSRGVGLVAISPQRPDGSLSTIEANGLAFPVLTDDGGAWARHLGLGFVLDEDVRDLQRAIGNDLAELHAGGEWELPRPTVLVVDADGIVRYVDVQADYTRRTHPQAILEAVRALA